MKNFKNLIYALPVFVLTACNSVTTKPTISPIQTEIVYVTNTVSSTGLPIKSTVNTVVQKSAEIVKRNDGCSTAFVMILTILLLAGATYIYLRYIKGNTTVTNLFEKIIADIELGISKIWTFVKSAVSWVKNFVKTKL